MNLGPRLVRATFVAEVSSAVEFGLAGLRHGESRTADVTAAWSAGSVRAIRSACQGLRIWRDFAGPELDDPVDDLGNVAGSGRMVGAFLLVP